MINPLWLKTFCTLVAEGHFTRTADKLFMTQSGVSQHVKKLEQYLNCELLRREGKRFSLTAQGKMLYEEGDKLLGSWQTLAQQVSSDDKYTGKVSIASPGSIGLQLYSQLLKIQQQYPTLIIDYRFAPNEDIESKLIAGDCDIGLMTVPSRHRYISCREIANEPLVLITPADVTDIDWPQLLKLGFIGHPDGQYHAQLLLEKNFYQFDSIEQFEANGFSNQISLICQPVSMGLGFTVLPLNAALAFAKQSHIKIHYLTHAVHEPLYIAHNNKSPQSARGEFIGEEIKRIVNCE
ncbi:MAG: LysR family transcriptional regulator [Psychrobium sp.]